MQVPSSHDASEPHYAHTAQNLKHHLDKLPPPHNPPPFFCHISRTIKSHTSNEPHNLALGPHSSCSTVCHEAKHPSVWPCSYGKRPFQRTPATESQTTNRTAQLRQQSAPWQQTSNSPTELGHGWTHTHEREHQSLQMVSSCRSLVAI